MRTTASSLLYKLALPILYGVHHFILLLRHPSNHSHRGGCGYNVSRGEKYKYLPLNFSEEAAVLIEDNLLVPRDYPLPMVATSPPLGTPSHPFRRRD
jgi:hypothetical protein